ncbi:MAG: hypothetical protein KME45_20325 [Stenomitos rutilans HA7619-LM2]|nr:hypothetical protein [Stenomitos rutilans HA7619-LM2]
MLDPLQQRINQHQRLNELRLKLLRLHKLLLEMERRSYEQAQGKVSKGQLLQLVIGHEQFAWLHQISELIVQIDELFDADEPVAPEAIDAFLADVCTLLTPDAQGNAFAIKYDAAFQHSPDVVLAHADIVSLLAPDSKP